MPAHIVGPSRAAWPGCSGAELAGRARDRIDDRVDLRVVEVRIHRQAERPAGQSFGDRELSVGPAIRARSAGAGPVRWIGLLLESVRLAGSPRSTSTSTLPVRTLLSFERPAAPRPASLRGAGVEARAHLENSIATSITGVLLIKRTRAHDGCLGTESR